MVNQFTNTLNKNQASELLRLMRKYSPETAQQKKTRLRKVAEEKAAGRNSEEVKPISLRYGIHQVTSLIENKEAKLVVIAHDVDPIELVCWLPTLCRKKDVPFCILKSKARLGALLHKKNAAVLCITSVRKEDKIDLDNLAKNFRTQYNDNVSVRRAWGGGVMGQKSQNEEAKKEKAIQMEQAKKMGLQASR
jgi:large subunit ribosomal protein L7Ae